MRASRLSLAAILSYSPSAPFLRPRRHIVRPFPALLRFPLTHDLVEWSGGSKFNLHFIRLNYLRRCWMDASCLSHGTSPTLTASPSLGSADEKTECPKRCCPVPAACCSPVPPVPLLARTQFVPRVWRVSRACQGLPPQRGARNRQTPKPTSKLGGGKAE